MQVNGMEKHVEEGMTLSAFAEQEGYQLDRIAVERNGEIVPKASYENTVLQDADILEIVQFVGGG